MKKLFLFITSVMVLVGTTGCSIMTAQTESAAVSPTEIKRTTASEDTGSTNTKPTKFIEGQIVKVNIDPNALNIIAENFDFQVNKLARVRSQVTQTVKTYKFLPKQQTTVSEALRETGELLYILKNKLTVILEVDQQGELVKIEYPLAQRPPDSRFLTTIDKPE